MGSGASAREIAREREDDLINSAKPRPPAAEYPGRPLPSMGLDDLPSQLVLRVDNESLTICSADPSRMPLRHFAYYTISSWGHTSDSFQWRVFGNHAPGSRGVHKHATLPQDRDEKELITFGFVTRKGQELETVVLEQVKLLMADMERRGIDETQFKGMLGQISMEHSSGAIDETPKNKAFTAHQCVSILRLVERICPFEKLDAAARLYTRMLNRDSYQLLINCFETIEDRENLCYRLKIPSAGGLTIDPVEAAERERLRTNNYPAIRIDCPSGLLREELAAVGGKAKLSWNQIEVGGKGEKEAKAIDDKAADAGAKKSENEPQAIEDGDSGTKSNEKDGGGG